MPNRIIKESICTSEDLDKLSQDAEILFYRLIVRVDDFGCFYGNPNIIKSTCFPLKSDVYKCEQVESWVSELIAAGLIIRYTASDGRQYIQFTKWAKHQNIRAKKSKFPQPESNCKQLQADASKCPRNPIQSNPNPIRNPNTKPAKTADYDDDGFESFWNAYPRKSGDIKQAYMEYIGALGSGASPQILMDALNWQAAEWEAEGESQFIPSPENWLKNRRWTEKKRAKPKKAAGKKGKMVSAYDYYGNKKDPEVDIDALNSAMGSL